MLGFGGGSQSGLGEGPNQDWEPNGGNRCMVSLE
jgi:hypothetical protein